MGRRAPGYRLAGFHRNDDFLLEFLLGFAYIWKKGGLDWE
ncbi:putative nADH-quinone oxidoreductase subunit A [Burkholderia cepacia]|nr:putative nADH-quinone oxidoreductase subunit A [Burkholderia cepacia]